MKLLMLGSGSYKSSLTYFRIVAIGQQLARLGWRISLVVPSADKYNKFTPDLSATLDGIELVQPWQPATHNLFLNLIPYLFTAMVEVIKRRPQVVYLSKPTPITIIGLIPKLLFGSFLVVDLDDLGSEVMRLEGQSNLQVWLVATCERLSVRFASAVVVTSTYLEQRIREQYPSKPVMILSNGVNPEEYPLAPGTTPRPVMYYFGAINRLELIESFLRSLPSVFAAVPYARAIILGGGQALGAAKHLAAELQIADRVQFTGWIDQLAVTQYAQFADIALCTQPDIPTVRAASNLKVFQYMSLGSVPVVSRVGDLPLYIGADTTNPAGCAVSAGSDQELSATLISLLGNPKGRVAMAQRARLITENEYAWPVLTRRLHTFLMAQTVKRKLSGRSKVEKHA